MGIHQALIGGYTLPPGWYFPQISLGNSCTLQGLEENDLVVFSCGGQFGSSTTGLPTSGFTGALSNPSLAKRIRYNYSGNNYTINEALYKRIASNVASVSITLPGDYAMAIVIRKVILTYFKNPYWAMIGVNNTNGTGNRIDETGNPKTEGHFPTTAGQLHLVFAYGTNGSVSTFNAPGASSSDTALTSFGFHSSSVGACSIAYNVIEATGNYEYGRFSVNPNSRPSVAFVEEARAYTS